MKTIYFVTEGTTDKIVLEGLVLHWLGDEDSVSRHVQPLESSYAIGLDTPLSNGWRGVRNWCAGDRPVGPNGRATALNLADLLVIHIDTDVAHDPTFVGVIYDGQSSSIHETCDWVRGHIVALLGHGTLPPNVVFCVPAMNLEAWVLSALHPALSDKYAPIEERDEPESLLLQVPPHRLVRSKGGRLRKDPNKYLSALRQIVLGWPNCAHGSQPRCLEAARFESEAKAVLHAV